jgi:NADH-quinone oxidoreductase subunit M
MVKRVVYGEVKSEGVAGLQDINAREGFVLGSLAVAVLILGLWPAPLVEVMEASIRGLIQHIAVSKLPL